MSSHYPVDLIRSGDLPADVVKQIRWAKETLERQGWADRLTELIGSPITLTMKMLPSVASDALNAAIDKSLRAALSVAIQTLGTESSGGETKRPRLTIHKILAGLSGAAGGAFGLSTVALELPVSTLLILRSIADIARSEGEDMTDLRSRLACLEVFAIDGGNQSGIKDGTEVGYFAVRATMSKQVADASKYIVQHGISDSSAPPLVRFLAGIASRFGVVVNEKIAAQAIPIIGAVGGALINTYFIDHYQELARAHFTIRRLERQYGESLIRSEYVRLGDASHGAE